MSFGKLTVVPKTGSEQFHNGPVPLGAGATVLDFWRWSASDLISNALRGQVAEFLVARALGATIHIRNEWDSYDLDSPSGLRIEVKSAAYLQTWGQTRNSSIAFGIGPTLAWDPDTNTFAPEHQRCRQADAYVFALLAHTDKPTLDPLDAAQWEFYVLSSEALDTKCTGQQQIGLASLLRLKPRKCSFSSLAEGLAALQIEPRPTHNLMRTIKARREGHPDTEITVAQYWALPEPERTETHLLLTDGVWVRPNRFISDGSDVRFFSLPADVNNLPPKLLDVRSGDLDDNLAEEIGDERIPDAASLLGRIS